jgi:hypothetical protein
MAFKTMDPALIQKLLKDEVDVITPAAKMESEVYKNAHCPACGHVGSEKVTLPPKVVVEEGEGMTIIRAPFSEHSNLVVGHAKCSACATEYSPSTGVIIKADQPILTNPNLDLTGE